MSGSVSKRKKTGTPAPRGVCAFELVGGGEGARWRFLPDPPGIVSLDGDDFAVAFRRKRTRVYVNGSRVTTILVLKPGDLVSVHDGGKVTTYRYGGRRTRREEGKGELCAFTRLPIEGAALRCACGALLEEAVAEQIGVCPRCGREVSAGEPRPPTEEVLL